MCLAACMSRTEVVTIRAVGPDPLEFHRTAPAQGVFAVLVLCGFAAEHVEKRHPWWG